MNNTIPDPAEPIGEVTIVKDFLPPPEQLIPKKRIKLSNSNEKMQDSSQNVKENILRVIDEGIQSINLEQKIADKVNLPIKIVRYYLDELANQEYIKGVKAYPTEGTRELTYHLIQLTDKGHFALFNPISASPQPNTANTEIIALWREKLALYQREEAITSDPEKKFQLKQLIQECLAKIEGL